MTKDIIKFCDILDDFVTIEIKPCNESIQASGMSYSVKIPDYYSCDCKKLSECGKCKIAEREFCNLRSQGFVFID